MQVALGVCTYNRPAFADKCLRAIRDHVAPLVCAVAVYNDGSDPKYHAEYRRAYKRLEGATIIEAPDNRGVASAKNTLLRWMLDTTEADWLILCEDDIFVQAPEAVTEYVQVAEETGLHHLSFAHHGPGNQAGPVSVRGKVGYYVHSIGAWCLYSRECLETVGLFDENFHNAWEHVELEVRLAQAGFMPNAGLHRFPDVLGSEQWLVEAPNSIEKSSIRPRDDWQQSIIDGLTYWANVKPETFTLLFGPGTQLEDYARGVLGTVPSPVL